MKRRSRTFQKLSSGKGFYITAAIAICAIIVSVAIAYYSTDRLGQKQIAPSDEITAELNTLPAEMNKTDVPDEREDSEPQEETTQAAEPERNSTPQTTAAPTTVNEAPVNNGFILPCDGKIIKKYSVTEPIYSKTMADWRTHPGIDFALEEGDEVHSVGNGKVTKVISDTKWGYVIEIDYGSFTGRYCGIKQDTAVKIDTEVKAGDVIGEVSTIPIEAEDGIHLHFEALKGGKPFEPADVLA